MLRIILLAHKIFVYLLVKLIDFIQYYPDEASCREKFKQYRDLVGVTCPRCGCKVHYWTGGKSQRYECKECGYRQSLRANTVLHHSHIPFRTWFIVCHLLTSTKSNFSVLEIQRQVPKISYKSLWWLVCKLRAVMGKDDNQHKLSGEIEIDEAFFKLSPIKEKNSHEHLTPVLVMAESESKTDNRYRIHRKFGHLKMKVVKCVTASELRFTAEKYIDKDACLRGDGTQAHNYMRSVFREVTGEVLKGTSDVMRALPWCHISIGHSKNQIRDIYHDVTEDYLQLYLDEFCWKKNHRRSNQFELLLKCVAKYRYVWRPIDRKFDMKAYLEKHKNLFGH